MAPPARATLEGQLDAASDACGRSTVQLTALRGTGLGLVLQADRPLSA